MGDSVEKIFSDVLKVRLDQISDASSPDTMSQWDSVSAIDLVLALEDNFSIRLTTKEIAAMRSVGLVKKVLRAKGVTDV